MSQQYGFRASNNLVEVADNNVCLANLGIDKRDLLLLQNTSASGVVQADYQAIIGLSSNLEPQIVTLTGYASSQLAAISTKATVTGDTFTGTIVSDIINNDRPYVSQANAIIGPSTVSYFSPSASGLFSTGGEYKLGGITAATITSSGLNYTGSTQQWSNYFSRYKNFAQVQEQPSWTARRVPLFLPPPLAISGYALWLDSEFSQITLDGSGLVEGWKGVGNGPIAAQTSAANRPSYVTNTLNGKPAIRFDGSNDGLNLGNLSHLFPTAATVIIVARVQDATYNLFSTANASTARWNDGSGNSNLFAFTSTIQNSFIASTASSGADFNGTFVYTLRVSTAFGLELRKNGVQVGYKATGFTYSSGSAYVLGSTVDGTTAPLNGDIHAVAMFNRVLSDKEARTMEEYFAWRYDGVYDPDRVQVLQLEDFASIELEDSIGGNNPLEA